MLMFWFRWVYFGSTDKYPCLLGIHSKVLKGDGTLAQQITLKWFSKKFLNCISTFSVKVVSVSKQIKNFFSKFSPQLFLVHDFAKHQVLEENTYIRAETLKYVHEKQNPMEKNHPEKGREH